MVFKATKEQVQQIAVNAVEASRPMGMGFMHYSPNTEFKPDMFKVEKDLNLDYVQGRMVKLYIREKSENEWEMRDHVDVEYQSWANKYPTCKDLLKSVPGVEVISD